MFQIPSDVQSWITNVFESCSHRTASLLMKQPNVHETTLDMTFIEEAANHSTPIRFPSEWVVQIDTHFLGGRRHFYSWEIADIGILIQLRKRGRLEKSKILLLQSKRLYPIEQEIDEGKDEDYAIGFSRLFREDVVFESVIQPRTFSFLPESRYKALEVGNEQYKAISEYEATSQVPVYYMLYHPGVLPYSIEVPRSLGDFQYPSEVRIGCRVLPAVAVHTFLGGKPDHYKPQYTDMLSVPISSDGAVTDGSPGWGVAQFVGRLALDCRVGYVTEKKFDKGIELVFNRRSGPIAAAISITFDAP